jgi:dynein heavy chain
MICADILQRYIDKNKDMPWADLKYLIGDVMYGGHITDHWDRRVNNCYLDKLFTEEILEGAELAANFNMLPCKHDFPTKAFAKYIEAKLPAESPTLFGLHPNAEVGYLTSSCDSLFGTVLLLSSSGGAEHTKDSAVQSTIESLLSRLPNKFDQAVLQENAVEVIEGPQVRSFARVVLCRQRVPHAAAPTPRRTPPPHSPRTS